jgi:hypothetical protein
MHANTKGTGEGPAYRLTCIFISFALIHMENRRPLAGHDGPLMSPVSGPACREG